MKKVLALVLAVMMLLGITALANAEVKLGQVDYAAHGAQCFAVITVAVEGETIVAAYIDEFQVMSGEGVVGVPNSDAAFGANIVGSEDGKVLGSKRVNNEYYSNNMATKAGSTVQLADNYAAIEAFAAGKTIDELTKLIAGQEAAAVVDMVSGATLVDAQGYLNGILEAAKAAAGVQTGIYTVYNTTGETVTELYIAVNETGDKGENLAGEGIANGECVVLPKTIPASMNGHGALTFTFTTESGYVGEFLTLSIEVAPINMLAADALTGATQISFFAPKAE